MANFEQLQQTVVLPFWEIILKAGLDAELNFTSLLNNSQSAVMSHICNFFIDPTFHEHRRNTDEFLTLTDGTKVFFMPKLISTCYINGSFAKRFIKFVSLMQNVACVGLNKIYLLLKSENKLSSIEAFDLQHTAKGVTKNTELCKKVVEDFELYPNSLFHMFSIAFDDKSRAIGKLRSMAFNLSQDLIPELVLKRYNGSATNGARLAEFLWNPIESTHLDFICNSTYLLIQQIEVYHKLESFHALFLFTYFINAMASKRGPVTGNCSSSMFKYAPGIVKLFMFSGRVCNCCDAMVQSELCIDKAINEIDAILLEHGDSDDANVTYPHQVMFLGYVLHSLMKSITISSNSSVANKVKSTQKHYNETYQGLYDEMMNEYFYQNHTPSNSLETLWFNKRFYYYFSQLMFQRAFTHFGLKIMSSMMLRLERILENKMMKKDIFCNCIKTLYSELASNNSLSSSEEAFTFYLYYENYVEMSDDQFDGSAIRFWGKIANKLCPVAKRHPNVIKVAIKTKLDYSLNTWNNLTLQPRLLQWHKTFELASRWLLPKLVRHVLDNNSTSLMELLDFFLVLKKQGYSEPLSLCPGLFELVLQMQKQPKYFTDVILKKILQMIPPSKNRHTAPRDSVSYMSYNLNDKRCRSMNTTIYEFINNKVV
jgi:hypothetical protein